MHLGGRVAYHLHSLGAAGVPAVNPDVLAGQPSGRGLKALGDWLDRVTDLGCGAVLLTPICVSSTHGYDTVDPFRIDQRLGDEDDFAAFADACHRRDLLLLLDGVFNHVGRDFPRFREVLAAGPDAAPDAAAWFRISPTDGSDGAGGAVPGGADAGGDGFAYHCFEGHRELPSLNHRSPAVLDWAVDVCRHWLDRGADGWRFDACYAIPPAFVSALVERVRSAGHTDAFLFGEMIHGDYLAFVEATGLDAVTQYELHKALWSSFNDANLFELSWALDRHKGFCEGFTPVTFVGNHDVTRIRTQLASPQHLGPALAALMTLPGHPCVYYGDELAWEGLKEDRAGGDDAIRPPLPPVTSPLPSSPDSASALDLHRSLVALRSSRPWLVDGLLEVESTANTRLAYTVTSASSSAALYVTLATSHDVPSPPTGWTLLAAGPGYAVSERS